MARHWRLPSTQTRLGLFPGPRSDGAKNQLYLLSDELLNPLLSGIPTCHGAGGMVGHVTFGGRTGGSVVLYGALYLVIGLFFSGSFGDVVHLFPRPVLGVILLFEAIAIMRLVRDVAHSKTDFSIVLIGGLIAASLPYGYLVSLIVGTLLFYLARRGLTSLGE